MDFILHNHVFVSTEMKFEWLYCWTMKLTARKKRHFLAWYNSPPFPGTAWWCPVRSGGAVWDTSPCPTLPGLPSERVPWLLGRGSTTHYCSVHPHRPGSGGLPVNKNKTIWNVQQIEISIKQIEDVFNINSIVHVCIN